MYQMLPNPRTLHLLVSAALLPCIACTQHIGGAEEPQQQLSLIDIDGDGIPDGIDVNGDGIVDFLIDIECEEPLLDLDADGTPDAFDVDCDGVADFDWCTRPLLDSDGDGVFDSIDFDCDGVADVGLFQTS